VILYYILLEGFAVKERTGLEEELVREGGPLSLREQLLGRLSDEDLFSKKREISVMARMSNDIVEILDALVELEIFRSRSETVSAFVEQAISSRIKMFEEIKTQAQDIRHLRDTAKKHAFDVFQEESS
jgi:Arc/MetJ-type ribon-helix-helix transcriptional regulator